MNLTDFIMFVVTILTWKTLKPFVKKLTWKKIFNPNPLEATWADKIKVRELIPKKYLHGAEYSYSPNLTLDKPCILKMNNASGRNELSLKST